MVYLMTESLAELLVRQRNELIIIGGVICLLLVVIIYFTFFRKKHAVGMELLINEQLLDRQKLLPTKEEILNATVEFEGYPSFIRILTDVLNHFSMDYLYSYGELASAFTHLVDFPKESESISSRQRGAMITIVRVFMTSEFIREKCAVALDQNFDSFMEEAGSA